MPHSRDPRVKSLISQSRHAIATSRDLIAHSVVEREQMRAAIRETRRVIEASRADRAKR